MKLFKIQIINNKIGQSIVEFAPILPLLLFLIIANPYEIQTSTSMRVE